MRGEWLLGALAAGLVGAAGACGSSSSSGGGPDDGGSPADVTTGSDGADTADGSDTGTDDGTVDAGTGDASPDTGAETGTADASAPSDGAPSDGAPSDGAPSDADVFSDSGCSLSSEPYPADAGPKTAISGLVDMQNISWHDVETSEPTFTMDNVNAFPGVFGGIVINATWRAIQPTQSGPLVFDTIDAALCQIRQYNAQHPSAPLAAKLRVYQGSDAPAWVESMGGDPVDIQRNPAGCTTTPCTLTVGRFWSAGYITAWRAFQALLAARYDGEPLIAQVAVTSCASQTDEPFVPTVDAPSIANLVDAGFTDEAEEDCLSGAVDDYAAWTSTLVDYTFNTFDSTAPADGGERLTADAGANFTLGVMQGCRAKIGGRCVLDNHALGVPPRAADMPVYDEMVALGPPVNFQTQAPAVFDCLWKETVDQGIAFGARSIEIWPSTNVGFVKLTVPEVQSLAAAFAAPAPVPSPLPTTTCPTFN
ncbi:MAG TPA: hypothetical protein VHV30_05340 [Polyangiaceae bacterium]|nr:hypothetical protein [Polyangiaceae bacterium]